MKDFLYKGIAICSAIYKTVHKIYKQTQNNQVKKSKVKKIKID